MTFADCHWPVWSYDDFTICFQHEYLQIVLPLAFCAVSKLLLITNSLLNSTSWTKKGYERLSTEDDDENHAAEHANGHVEDGPQSPRHKLETLPTDSTQTVRKLDRPKGMLLIVIVEALLSSGALGISIAEFIVNAWGDSTLSTSVAHIIVWTYITVLVFLRLFATVTLKQDQHTSRFSSLWYHTASLYFPLCICSSLIFRSQIMYPRSGRTLALASSHFALLALLFLISICSRIGNAPVYLHSEPGLDPCLEPTASFLSKISFWWFVPLMRKAYSKTIEHEEIWDNIPRNKSATVVREYSKEQRKGRLWFRVISFFKHDLFVGCLWSFLFAITYFVPSLLLKVILEFLENPAGKSLNTAWLAAALTVVNGILATIGHNQALWAGRRISTKIQALLFSEIYQKSLRRRIVGTKEKILGNDSKKADIKKASAKTDSDTDEEESEEVVFDEPSVLGMWKFFFAWPFESFWPFKRQNKIQDDPKDDDEAVADTDKDEEGQASTGAVTALMSSDIQIIHEACAYLGDVFVLAPLQLIFCVGFLFKLIGRSTFVTLAALFVLTYLQYIVLKEHIRLEKKITSAKDARIHQTSEVVANIRIVKLFAWESRFLATIDLRREIELKFLRRQDYVHSAAYIIFVAAPTLMATLTFLVYTLVEGRSLPPSVAFPALSIIFLLQTPLDILADMINFIQMALVSVNRIEEYLDETDSPKYTQLQTVEDKTTGQHLVGFDNATFSWGSKGADDFKLFDLDMRFVPGINVVFGPTGSGKTSLLSALLGEMKQMSGSVYLPGSTPFQDLKPDPQTGLTESVAYCAQTAWLVNNTVKQNILFASPTFDEQRYKQVLHACSLERDIEIWKKGHETSIGDNGITISGGQKQRISLARALYSSARYLLLDDVLSAVDSHTARWIVEEALQGPLVENRTCIIVSHNTALTLPCASFSVALKNGRVAAQGKPAEVIANVGLSNDESGSRPPTQAPSRINTPKPSQVNLATAGKVDNLSSQAEGLAGKVTNVATTGAVGAVGGPMAGVSEALNSTPANPITESNKGIEAPLEDLDEIGAEKETQAVGAVKLSVLYQYCAAAGGPIFWISCFLAITLRFSVSTAQNAWVRIWANSYGIPVDQMEVASQTPLGLSQASNISFIARSSSHHYRAGSINLLNMYSTFQPDSQTPSSIHLQQTAERHSDGYYVGIYALIGLSFAVVAATENLISILGALTASQGLHRRLMESLAFAKWRWYDTTPNGRITNRFTNDMTEIDEQAAGILHAFSDSVWNLVTCLAVISFLLPQFLLGATVLVFMYFLVARFYINCSRDLKRISSVRKSPILQQFQETLSGVVTIRAYGHQRRFAVACQNKADDYLRPFIFNWASNRWLTCMGDSLSTGIAFITIVVVVANAKSLDAGSAGLAITYSLNFNTILNFLMRFYALLEQNMNAVERVTEFSTIEREAQPIVEESRPPADWPSKGAIQFSNYSTKYAKHFDYALRDLTFKVPAAAKVGVIGRTGAGKSSLALALFRALEADTGSITVDGIDISKLGLHDLRESVLMVPQDPTLFQGTLRSNLDPFSVFTDEEIFDCLRKVHLIDSEGVPAQSQKGSKTGTVNSKPASDTGSSATLAVQENQNVFYKLSTKVAEGGKNFSQGQRQLLCLARALLKSPKILLMDEATASIDYATDTRIQAALREFKHTFITIAHRLRTIIDYDKILVLDKGCLKEYGHPWELLNNDESQFKSMCEATGELEALMEEAKKAFETREQTLLD